MRVKWWILGMLSNVYDNSERRDGWVLNTDLGKVSKLVEVKRYDVRKSEYTWKSVIDD